MLINIWLIFYIGWKLYGKDFYRNLLIYDYVKCYIFLLSVLGS